MRYDFDQIIDRQQSDSVKWNYFAKDVLPMWVADMDFLSPDPVRKALLERAAHGMFGYAYEETYHLRGAIVNWLKARFDWQVEPEALMFLPGVVVGFNLVAQALIKPTQAVAYQTPVYMPFLRVAHNAGTQERVSHLVREADGRYTVDWDEFENALDETTAMFLLCSPHNPVGRVWERWELERMAEICLRKNIVICSDEIHGDLVYSPNRHIPMGSLNPEIARQTVTLMAPSKTFNIPGLGFSFAVVQNPELRKKIESARRGSVGETNLMGMVAAKAAYAEGAEWLEQALDYLKANRDFMVDWLARELPELKCSAPEGTYLAWIDCSAVKRGDEPLYKFMLERGRVAFNDGPAFGPGGEGFIRLNFACPRKTLEEGLERLRRAVRST